MMGVYVFPFDSQMLIKAWFVEALSPVLGLVQNNIPSLFLIEPSLCKAYPNGKKYTLLVVHCINVNLFLSFSNLVLISKTKHRKSFEFFFWMVVKTKQTISCGGKALKRGPNKTVRQRIRISFLVFIICTKILSVSAFCHVILCSENWRYLFY